MLPLRAAWPGALLSLCACSTDEAGAPPAAERELARLLGPGQGRQVAAHVLGANRGPLPAGSAAARAFSRPELSLPERADEPFELRDPRSQLAIAVQSSAALAVPAQGVGALSVYADAHGSGTALLLEPNEHGLEDYVSFAAPPAAPQLEYRVELDPAVRGLRLVARSLEFLDAGGAPRLRVEPPVVIGADGARTPALLEVLDCDVDRSPAAPWGRTPRDPGASSCALRVTWDPERVAYPALVDPVWSGTGSLSQARESFASLVLPEGRVLVAGGLTGTPGEASASAEIYDPASGTWSVTGSLSTARSTFTLTERDTESGSGALAVGGIPQGTPQGTAQGTAQGTPQGTALSSSEFYDAASGLWSPGPELPEPIAGHGAVRFDSGDVLVAGGTALRASLLAVGASDWSDAGELLAAEPGASLTLLENQDVLLVGPNAPSAQRYARDGNRWRAIAEPALGRSEHTATRLQGGQVLLVGGQGSRSAELYDPANDSFHFVGALNEARSGHTATLLGDGRVVVVGGSAVPGALATETYNPSWGTWTSGPGSAQSRTAHGAVPLGDGRLLVIGGQALDGQILASSELLEPSTLPTSISEYKLPARLDPEVTASTATELWAAVARPATLVEGRRYPLLVFLHGNHGTCGSGENPRSDFDCTYTESGVCPDGFVVVPSHRGYDYVAQELAARGFVVVSVNANRGITCGGGEAGDFGFNLARGRLLLQHLRQLSAWNRGTAPTPESLGVSLEGKLDFNEVGMLGHSRGGEGVRAAYEQYRDPGSPWPRRILDAVTFRALFEIGPVDGQTSRLLNADGVAWNVLLPMCDGDVSDLEGVKPFDRMLGLTSELRETPKSTYVAWGANHNFFNTEWQESDSPGCQDHRALFQEGAGITGSAEQRQVGLRAMLSFFLANVGKDKNPALSELFDPSSPVEFNTRIDRGYTSSLRANRGISLEDFSGSDAESAHGIGTLQKNVQVVHGGVPEHDPELRAAQVSWTAASPELRASAAQERFLQIPFSAAAGGIDLSAYTHLDFRVGRAEADELEEATPLLVQLVNADGSLSEPVAASEHGVRLDGPVGGPFDTHVVLQTARIPFSAFSATRAAVRGVRFSFPGTAGARLYLASVRAGLGSASLSPIQASLGKSRPGTGSAPASALDPRPLPAPSQITPGERPTRVRQLVSAGNTVVALRAVQARSVEIELDTRQPFRAQDDQLVLSLGNVRTNQSRHPAGSLARIIFTLDQASFANARDGVRIQVGYASNSASQWDFGPLNKAALQP